MGQSKLPILVNLESQPQHFINRPEIFNKVKEKILNKNDVIPGKLRCAVIHGLPGSGKSTIAKALAWDEEIRKEFSYILWTTLGQEPEVSAKSNQYIDISQYISSKLDLLRDKKVLIIIDDAWEVRHVKPFLLSEGNFYILITTRNEDIAYEPSIATKPEWVGAMTEEEALELMEKWLDRDWSAGEESKAREVAKEIGYLPLALEIIITLVEKKIKWENLLSDLRAEIARLEEIEVGERSLVASINLSLKLLNEEQREAFAWLGILPKDVNITGKMMSTIWQKTEAKADKILSYLKGMALLSHINSPDNTHILSYRIHDVLHDTARNLLCNSPDQDCKNKFSGFGIQVQEAHRILLERYFEKCDRSYYYPWGTLPNDNYIYSYLTWHMEKAETIEEIHNLLNVTGENGKNNWYQIRENLGQLAGYKEDIQRAWRLTRRANEKFIKTSE